MSVVAPADLHYDGIVNFFDFAVLADYWLENEPEADIQPIGGDDVVNPLDVALIAEHWLEQFAL